MSIDQLLNMYRMQSPQFLFFFSITFAPLIFVKSGFDDVSVDCFPSNVSDKLKIDSQFKIFFCEYAPRVVKLGTNFPILYNMIPRVK